MRLAGEAYRTAAVSDKARAHVIEAVEEAAHVNQLAAGSTSAVDADADHLLLHHLWLHVHDGLLWLRVHDRLRLRHLWLRVHDGLLWLLNRHRLHRHHGGLLCLHVHGLHS